MLFCGAMVRLNMKIQNSKNKKLRLPGGSCTFRLKIVFQLSFSHDFAEIFSEICKNNLWSVNTK